MVKTVDKNSFYFVKHILHYGILFLIVYLLSINEE